MQKPDVSRLPTSQMLAFLQVFNLPQGGDNETKERMVANLGTVTDEQWATAEVKFHVDQL